MAFWSIVLDSNTIKQNQKSDDILLNEGLDWKLQKIPEDIAAFNFKGDFKI